jgi:hypothetical protein
VATRHAELRNVAKISGAARASDADRTAAELSIGVDVESLLVTVRMEQDDFMVEDGLRKRQLFSAARRSPIRFQARPPTRLKGDISKVVDNLPTGA